MQNKALESTVLNSLELLTALSDADLNHGIRELLTLEDAERLGSVISSRLN